MKTQFTFRTGIGLLSLIATTSVSAQDLLWETHAQPGQMLMTDARTLAHDDDGNLIVAGYFNSHGNTADLDPGPGVTALTTNVNEINAFVAKYSPTGQVIWARSFLGNALGHAYGVTTDGSGDIYVTGMFLGTVDFNGGPSEYLMTATTNEDGFLVKYRASGEFMWARQFATTGFSEGHGVAFSGDGIYVTGTFTNTMDLDPSAGTMEVSSNGERDVFVAKYDVVGNAIWVKNFGGTDFDSGMAITADATGTVTLAGIFSDTVDFDPDPALTEEHASTGLNDVFVARFDSSGELVFARTAASTESSSATAVVSDADGNIYVGGQYKGVFDLDPTSGSDVLNQAFGSFADGFVMKYDPAGTMLWGKSLHGASHFSLVTGLAVDDFYGKLYVTASYNGAGMDADPGPGLEEMAPSTVRDLLFGEYDLDGDMIWARSLGGNYDDELLGVVVNTDGSLCIAGYYASEEIDVDPSSVDNIVPGSGNRNLLLASYGTSALAVNEASESTVSLFPNPTGGALSLTFSGMEDATAVVTDLHGKTVIPSQTIVSGCTLALNDLPAGVYLVRIAGSDAEHVARIVKR
jgi:hypothetical protein